MKSDEIQLVVVPHTHWDREWYLPLESYRYRLVQMLDRVLSLLDSGSLPSFVLDGQTVVVDDYLERRPEKRTLIRRLVKDGKLSIGPWYVLADEFLTSGEALLRNLEEGQKTARALGAGSRVAYTPDPFGHISQLPQIVSGFSLDGVVFARGIGEEQTSTVYLWQGADGTTVDACLLPTSYSNGRLLCETDDVSGRLQHELKRLESSLEYPVALVCAGSDHEFPHKNLGASLEQARESLYPTEVVIGTLDTYLQSLRALQRAHSPKQKLSGELRGSRLLPLLPGVLSARTPLKQANDACLDLLEGKVEPFSVLATFLGHDNPQCHLKAAWKELLLNQAHDSICGCSVDAVHRENLIRFERVRQIGQAVLGDSASFLSRLATCREEDERRVIFHPLAWGHRGVARVTIEERFDPASIPAPSSWQAFTSDGSPRQLQKLEESVGEADFPFPAQDTIRTSHFLVETAASGLAYETVLLRPGPEQRTIEHPCLGTRTPQGCSLQNQYLRVDSESCGTFSIVHLKSGRRWNNLGLLKSEADRGDSYNFDPVPGDPAIRGFNGVPELELAHQGPLRASFQVKGKLRLPVGLDETRERRIRQSVLTTATFEVILNWNSPYVEIQLSIDNQSKDHRLRIDFPLNGSCGRSRAQTPFDIVQRNHPTRGDESWLEDPSTTHPQRGVCFIPEDTTDKNGLAVLAGGLPEYELQEGTDILSLTLLRCVGWLSRADIRSRRCQAGPKIKTPEAQCRGRHLFRLAVMPFSSPGPVTNTELLRWSRAFALPPWSVDPDPPIGWGQESWPRVPERDRGDLPSAAALLSLEGEQGVLTTFHLKDEHTAIARVLQAEETSGTCVLRMHSSLGKAWSARLANLAGQPLKRSSLLSRSDDPSGITWQVPLRARGLTTILLSRQKGKKDQERDHDTVAHRAPESQVSQEVSVRLVL